MIKTATQALTDAEALQEKNLHVQYHPTPHFHTARTDRDQYALDPGYFCGIKFHGHQHVHCTGM